jgi:predicted CopG family antitoxin
MKPKKKKGNQKPKLNITLREDTKRKLAALAELEKRSVSNLIEVMADERWEELAERGGHRLRQDCCRDRGLKWLKRR